MARRAQHDTQYWAEHVARQQASGLSIREYCERESLQVHHFYYHRKRVTTGQSKDMGHRANAPEFARPVKMTSQPVAFGTAETHGRLDHSQTVVIRIGDHAAVHVPATMLATIEAVLKMALSFGEPASQQAGSAFRSVIVRS